MPKSTILEMPPEEQAQRLAAPRRARYGYLRALQILLVCAVGRTPTEMADALCCSRSRVYRTVRAYRAGTPGLEPDPEGRLSPPPADDRAGAPGAAVAARPAQGVPPGLWLVSHARELCHVGPDAADHTRGHRLG
jgi:hypothetical protein